MTIAPIIHTVDIKAPPERAFELFATRMTDWWPKGRTVAKTPHEIIVVEPRAEGRWVERDAEGRETQWGKVLEWEPPSRLLLGWQLDASWTYNPDFLTEVELTFTPLPSGGTRVTLEHRDLERFGTEADARRGQLDGGWPGFLKGFGAFADAEA